MLTTNFETEAVFNEDLVLQFYQISQNKSLGRMYPLIKFTQEDHFPLNLKMGHENQKSALL